MTHDTGERPSLVIHDLRIFVDEAQAALSAIRSGEVDALVVAAGDRPQVFVLEGAEHAYRVLFETLNEGAMTIAADATILYANRKLTELLERPRERILGARLGEFIAPEDAEAFALLLHEAASGAGKREIALATGSGGRVSAMVSMSRVGDEAGSAFTVVMTDLTLMKEARLALERANGELEARVAARTEEFAQANAALRVEMGERARLTGEIQRRSEALLEADRRKDEFLSMLAHELRNPLAPIFTAVEMLRLTAPGVERYRSVIDRQARNLARIVDDLLDVSRITRRAITLRVQPVELATVVRSAVDAARPLIDAGAHELTVALPEEPARIFVDPTRFEQVLVNLLNNAAKYSEKGGQIHLSASVQARDLVLCVRDTGVGIPADLLPNVFDLFVQGSRSLDRSQGGLGIGLTLVKSLVEMHGGHIEARSAGEGRGSEFVVHLPVVLEGSSPPAALLAPASGVALRVKPDSARTRRRVLIVEDNQDASTTLIDLLTCWGYEVCHSTTGDEALLLASTFQPQILLIDIGLPGMNGYEVARRMRRDGGRSRAGEPEEGLLLIALSGYGQASDQVHGREAGFDHYLIKPPDPNVLRGLLEGRVASVG